MRGPLLVCVAIAFAGCTCSKEAPQPAASASAAPAPPASSSAAAAPAAPRERGRTASVYSAPIAAGTLRGGDAVVAGLVVPSGSIATARFAQGASPAATADALGGVGWSPDSRLEMLPVGDGAALLWVGPRDGGASQTIAMIDAKGAPAGAPFTISTGAPCATQGALAWADRESKTTVRVRARALAAQAPSELATLTKEPTPELVCADHVVYAIVDGEEERTLRALALEGAPDAGGGPAPVTIDESIFGEDDEREFEKYTVGDELGIVRVGGSGQIAFRETRDRRLGAWKRLAHKLGNDDDVVAIDADASSLAIVYTNDESESCSSSETVAKSVWALRVDRKNGKELAAAKLAPASCGMDVGPFWIAEQSDAMTAVWLEVAPAGGGPPLRGFAFHSLAPGSEAAETTHVDLPADAMVDAGCGKDGCAVAALVRDAGGDGMQAGPVALLRYP